MGSHSAREGNKTETDVLWTCDANQWPRKRNDAGMWRRKEGKRTTKNEGMDEIHERTAMSLAGLRDAVRDRGEWRQFITMVARVPKN